MFDKNEVFEALNALSAAFKAQFENPPAIPLMWTERDGDGMAFIDDEEVCPIAMIDIEGLQYGEEDLWILLVDGDEVNVQIGQDCSGRVTINVVE